MICSLCNKEFTPTGRYQKNCSIKCTKKKYLESHKGKLILNKAQKKFRESTHGREAIKKYDKEYAQTDAGKETKKKANKNYRKTDKSKIAIKRYAQSNKGKGTAKKYNQSNRGKETTKRYVSTRRKKDPIFKLAANMRVRLNGFLKTKNIRKNNKTFVIVGCSPEFLKKHLEKQFHRHPDTYQPMNWKNHTVHGWHIDHKIPLSSAKTSEDKYKLCHYTNLQPMWAEYNLKKGARH
tara:strand:+ start:41 stop:748 length:708 start_codon:yes stop_codon:yes gene_type:complete